MALAIGVSLEIVHRLFSNLGIASMVYRKPSFLHQMQAIRYPCKEC
jgi:hypothetical protein